MEVLEALEFSKGNTVIWNIAIERMLTN
jgi:hypothetical protein